jgi:hypothetical protein
LFCPAVGGRRRRFAGVCTQYVPTFGAGPPGQGRSPRPKRPPGVPVPVCNPGPPPRPGSAGGAPFHRQAARAGVLEEPPLRDDLHTRSTCTFAQPSRVSANRGAVRTERVGPGAPE